MKKILITLLAVFCVGVATVYSGHAEIWCDGRRIGSVVAQVNEEGFLLIQHGSNRPITVVVEIYRGGSLVTTRTVNVPATNRLHNAGRVITPTTLGREGGTQITERVQADAVITSVRCN